MNCKNSLSVVFKTLIVFIALVVIYFELKGRIADVDTFFSNLHNVNFSLLAIAFLLLPVNWGLEAMRWQKSVSMLQTFSFKDSVKSVLVGLISGLLTPNRVGEFLGRLYNVSICNRKRASILWFYGTFLFSAAVFLIGGPFTLYYAECFDFRMTSFWGQNLVLFALLPLALLSILICFMARRKVKKGLLFVKSLPTAFSLSLLLLAAIRYAVFSFQFALIMYSFQVDSSVWLLIISSLVSYFIATIVPSFFFTDAIVRSSIAALVLAPHADNIVSVMMSSILTWIINVAIPTMVGCVVFYASKWNLNGNMNDR